MRLPKIDHDTHTYWLGKRQIISVTQVLKEANIIDATWYTEHGRQRGTGVHAAIHLYGQDDLNEEALDPVIIPYLETYKSFLRTSGFQVLHCERIVYSEKYHYCGTFDLYGLLNDRLALIDVKTENMPSWVGIQLAAYDQAAQESGFKKATLYSLTLKEGYFRLKKHPELNDLKKFIDALIKIGVYDGNS